MKYRFLILLLLSSLMAFAKEPALLVQRLNALAVSGKKFKIEVKFRNEATAQALRIVPFLIQLDAENKEIRSLIDIKHYNAGSLEPNKWTTITYSDKVQQGTLQNIAVGFIFKGKGKAYIADFKLFIYDGSQEKEIPLQNGNFTNENLDAWKVKNLRKESLIQIQKEQSLGKNTLLIDNTHVKEVFVEPGQLGNNTQIGKYIAFNGIRLYYERYGEEKGVPILLIHGNNGNMTYFSNQINDLLQQYSVIGLDSRGQGKSTMDSTRLTYELMAEDVNTFLNSLHLKKVNILGWSDGGNVAVALALKYPDKINKMAIMGTVLYNNSSSVRFWTNPLLRIQVGIARLKGMKKDNPYYRMKKLLLTEPNINPERLKNISIPTLVMAGAHDVVREKHTRLIAEKIPNSTLKIFKNAGHEAPWQVPQEFNKTVLDFFNTKD